MNTVYLNQQSFMCSCFRGTYSASYARTNAHPDWFDPSEHLGKKGHRYLSQPIKYVLSAAKAFETNFTAYQSRECGVFIGTNSVDIDTRRQISNKLNCGEDPVGAASAPNCSVNIAASILAEKLKFHGSCFTFTGGEDCALFAFWKAVKSLSSKHLNRAVIGQVESHSNFPLQSGAILWDLSSREGESSQEINDMNVNRWASCRTDLFPMLETGEMIYFIGRDGNLTAEFSQYLANKKVHLERIWNTTVSQSISQNMQLFANISLLIQSRAEGRIFIMSNSGHIFHFKLSTRR